MRNNSDKRNIIIGFICLISALLLFKSAQLQLFTSKYKERAKKITLFRNVIYPARGILFDRNKNPLVKNFPIYEIHVTYNKVNPAMDTAQFCSLLGITKQKFSEYLDRDWTNHQFHKAIPFVFMTKIDPTVYSRFQEHLYKFPGFFGVQRYIRAYPYHHAAHVLGYVGEVDKETIESSDGFYSQGDYIGVSGIEYAYERDLAGQKGVEYVMRDYLGRMVGSFDDGKLDSAAVSGEDIMLSLDIELQKYGEKLLHNKRGAIVAIEPSTGEILAMVSSPTYDPNILNLNEKRGEGMRMLLSDLSNRPLNNRAVTNKYPPGSIFKPIISLIAMQKGTTYADRTIPCPGFYRLSPTKVQKCHLHATPTNVAQAIQHSCNTYYFQMYREFLDQYGYTRPGKGLDTLVSYLSDFGLGKKLGLDFSYENRGFLPNDAYYRKMYKKEVNGWRAVWTLSVGIGQGEMQLTTVQMANLAAILANRGYYYTPHLIKKYISGKPISPEFTQRKKVRIDKKYFLPVIDGLERVVTSGTGRVAFVPGLDICGKTGTSENAHGKDHSVFFGFAPKNNPKIAIAVFVENAGFGAQWAAPVASLMIEKYLKGNIDFSRLYLEARMVKGSLIEETPPYSVYKDSVFRYFAEKNKEELVPDFQE